MSEALFRGIDHRLGSGIDCEDSAAFGQDNIELMSLERSGVDDEDSSFVLVLVLDEVDCEGETAFDLEPMIKCEGEIVN
jgi:hypothetical protein